MIWLSVFLTCLLYSILTLLVHFSWARMFPVEFQSMTPRKRRKLDFRAVRTIAGIQCMFFFLYGLFMKDELGFLGVNKFTKLIFESYLGYTIFEVMFVAFCARKVSDMMTKPGLRLLMVHHLLAGTAAYLLLRPGPSPHYLALITLGNEFVVISYSITQMGEMLGKNNHNFVRYNAYSLPFQYIIRQLMFFHIAYTMFEHYEEMTSVCSDWFSYSVCFGGLNFVGLVINPYWTYETLTEAYKYKKLEKSQKGAKNKVN